MQHKTQFNFSQGCAWFMPKAEVIRPKLVTDLDYRNMDCFNLKALNGVALATRAASVKWIAGVSCT